MLNIGWEVGIRLVFMLLYNRTQL